MTELANNHCEACRADAPLVEKAEQMILLNELPEWQIVEVSGVEQLQRIYPFKNFKQALEFTNHIAEIAELEHHHPALTTEYGKVTVAWWTHKIHGLHHNDFVMAAKTEEIYHHRIEEALANI